jgi:hypothetical protein
MSNLAPPNEPLAQVRTTQQVSLRSEASVQSSREAYLQAGAIGWVVGRADGWAEVWVHGFVAEEYLKPAAE